MAKKWSVSVNIIRATGIQVFIVDAETKEEAEEKYYNGVDTEFHSEGFAVQDSDIDSIEELKDE